MRFRTPLFPFSPPRRISITDQEVLQSAYEAYAKVLVEPQTASPYRLSHSRRG